MAVLSVLLFRSSDSIPNHRIPITGAKVSVALLLEGFIATSPSGTKGFGYDSLLFIPEVNKTSAELEADEKNAISHRGEAVRHIASYFSIADHLVVDQN